MAVRLEKIILEVEDRASRPMATFAQSTRGASEALHDLDGSSSDSAQAITSTGKAAGTAAPKVSNLAAATAKAEAAQRKQADAAGALRVAEAKLAEVREKGTAKAGAVAAAEERVAKARRDLSAETSKAVVASAAVAKANDDVAVSARRADSSINQLTGRLAVFRDVAAILGPGLVPIAAVGVPAITGVASALGFVALGAGAVVAGFQGVGDTLKALDKAQLEPTAANLAAARLALEQLSPAARQIVGDLDRLQGSLTEVRDASAAGLAPGINAAADDLLVVLPKVRDIFGATAEAAGDLFADSAASLASDRYADFFRFLEREAPAAISSLGAATGDLVHGLTELWQAFDPLSDDVLGVLERGASGFDRWASGLAQTQGFQDFVAYVRENGPLVGDALASVANAVLKIGEAAAPLGGPVLQGISGVADVVATIAGSDLGAPFVAALAAAALLNRTLLVTAGLQARIAAATAASSAAGGAAAAGAAGAAGAAASTSKLKTAGTAGIAGLLGAGGADAIQNQFSGIESSVESLASKLQSGSIPSEFDNLRDSIVRVSDPNIAQGFQDNIYDKFSFLGSDSRVDEAVGQFESLDQALTQVASNQGSKSAEQAFQSLGDRLNLTGDQMSDLRMQLPQFRDATNTGFMDGFIDNMSDVAGSMKRTSSAARGLVGSIKSVDAAFAGRATARDYEASLDDATAALKQNGRTLDINTAKGRANQAALDNIAASARKVADGMRGANKVEFLKGARADFVSAAKAMGMGEKAAQRLADKLGLVARVKVKPKIDIDTDGLDRKTARARAALLSLDRQKPNPKADLNTTQFSSKQRRALNDVGVLDRQKPTPTADMNDNPFRGRRAAVMAALGVTDRFTANPTVSVNDLASGRLAAIRADIASIQSKSVDIVVNTFRNVFGKNENGGLYDGPVRAFADGGYGSNGRYYSRDPQIVAGGANIMWGEKSTGWEAYISGKPAQRQRNISILDEAASRLGVAGPGEAMALAARNAALLEQINSGGRQSAAAASAPRMAPQSVSVGFDGPAEVMVRMPDGSRQIAQIAARVADDRIDNYISSENARAGA